MKHFYKLAIVLAYIHTYFMRNRCVRKVFLAENEPDSGVKSGDGKGSYDDDVLMEEVINLLSLHALGQEEEEQKNPKKRNRKNPKKGNKKNLKRRNRKNPKKRNRKNPKKRNRKNPKKRVQLKGRMKWRLSYRQTHFLLEDIKKCKRSSEEEVQEKGTTSSASSSKDAPEEKPEKLDDLQLDEFRHVLKECDDIFFEIDDEKIEEYLKAGIHSKEKISELNNEYPLNLSKGINFDNPRAPFGVVEKNFEKKSENEIRATLYFDDFLSTPLYEFLNNTMVGELSLAKVNFFYVKERIKYQPCNNFLLNYLGTKNKPLNIDSFLCLNIGTYLSQDKCEICNFCDTRIRAIREKNVENDYTLERLKQTSVSRHLNYSERKKLREIVFHQLQNISYLRKALSFFAEKRNKIKKDAALLSQNFSLPKNYLYKDVILLTCLHYVISYAIVILKPLKIKVDGKIMIGYREFYFVSGLLNQLIFLLEFMEHNSIVSKILYDI
ncbi:hypothetical protein PCYB_127870 [Plasmodium cynomolgi strain B]|uniref:Uncharacterized protein n=1 Tax=Plasmodium cynomolgi (strain B) TaxID=1120755 RepID=K6VFY6_PLACD|nr:hypothetical protein PCYB_127870 [Plasmodium cynomolgi strain B]GAB68222.1 hypothetical protein PCYB_127870 [Plasmodium cynomolgi strain B]